MLLRRAKVMARSVADGLGEVMALYQLRRLISGGLYIRLPGRRWIRWTKGEKIAERSFSATTLKSRLASRITVPVFGTGKYVEAHFRYRHHQILISTELNEVLHMWPSDIDISSYLKLRGAYQGATRCPELYSIQSREFLEQFVGGVPLSAVKWDIRHCLVRSLTEQLRLLPTASIESHEKCSLAASLVAISGQLPESQHLLDSDELNRFVMSFPWVAAHTDLLTENILLTTDFELVIIDLDPFLMRYFPSWFDPLTVILDGWSKGVRAVSHLNKDPDTLLEIDLRISNELVELLGSGMSTNQAIELWCLASSHLHGWSYPDLRKLWLAKFSPHPIL